MPGANNNLIQQVKSAKYSQINPADSFTKAVFAYHNGKASESDSAFFRALNRAIHQNKEKYKFGNHVCGTDSSTVMMITLRVILSKKLDFLIRDCGSKQTVNQAVLKLYFNLLESGNLTEYKPLVILFIQMLLLRNKDAFEKIANLYQTCYGLEQLMELIW